MRITPAIQEVVEAQGLGFVATTNEDGTPNLSPKGTTAVWDQEHLVFAHIHSPGTVRNIEAGRDAVEVNVVDPIRRKGFRFRGTAQVHASGYVYEQGLEFYARRSGLERRRIRAVVLVRVEAASELVSPAYDDGTSEAEVEARFLRRHRLVREPAARGAGGV